MRAALTSLYVSATILVGAFLFIGVDWLEPNRRLTVVFKLAIIAVSVAAIANRLLPGGLAAVGMGR